MTYGGVKHSNDRTWAALGLVLCAHLAAFAVLRPQPEVSALETLTVPLSVSLLSAPQTAPQKTESPVEPTPRVEKTVKPKAIQKKLIPHQAKPAPPFRKTPVSKPLVERNQASIHAPVMPVEQASPSAVTDTPSKPTAKPAEKPANKPATAAPGYQSPSFNASYLDNPAPNYPPVSRRLGEQGKVLLRVQVSASGTADSVTLQTSSGSTRLDQAALAAVKKWRFVPAKRGGQAVSASVIVPVSFSLEG